MKKINLVLIGAGNVMRSRHLPALRKNRNLFHITGIIDIHEAAAEDLARRHNVFHYASIKDENDLVKNDWFLTADAVIVGIPPQYHFQIVRECLMLGKHVIVEKPFTVSVEHAKELVDLAKQKHLVLVVKHNFQFTRSFIKLENLMKNNALGKITSIYGVQLTNYSRRIPAWTEGLPLGLFYDESPHFFYLIHKFTNGDIRIHNVFQYKSKTRESTPKVINLNLEANNIPVTIYWNFESPVCEWYFTILGEKKIAAVDLFRDILILLPNDAPHLGYQVMRTSVLSTLQHWKGIILNGFSYLQNKLYYGFDTVQLKFYYSIMENDLNHLKGISAEDGLYVTEIQNKIADELKLYDTSRTIKVTGT